MTFSRHFPHWPPNIPHRLEVPEVSVYMNLAAGAQKHPDTAAIDYYGTRISYVQLKREADALAGFLQQRCGVRKGDRVLLYLQNSPQFVIGYYAILRADAVAVPVNPMNLTEELRHYIEDAETAVAIVGQERLGQIAPLLGEAQLKKIVLAAYSDYLDPSCDLPVPDFVRAPRAPAPDGNIVPWADVLAAGLAPGAHLAGPDDLATMPYTSGTTGKPKGCMHTHHNVQSTAFAYLQWRGSSDGGTVTL